MMKSACPKCNGKGGMGAFGPCPIGDIHFRTKCPTCKGKGKTRRTQACNSCQCKGGQGTFGPCEVTDIHFKSNCLLCKGRCYTKQEQHAQSYPQPAGASMGFNTGGFSSNVHMHATPSVGVQMPGFNTSVGFQQPQQQPGFGVQMGMPGFNVQMGSGFGGQPSVQMGAGFGGQPNVQMGVGFPGMNVQVGFSQPQWPIGVFYIKSKHNGLYLDAKGQGTSPGTDIIMWNKNHGNNQKWSFEQGGVIRNVHNGLAIDIKGGHGADIHLWPYEGKTHQQWKFENGMIISVANGQVLDVKGGGKQAGVEACVWTQNGGTNQQWELERA